MTPLRTLVLVGATSALFVAQACLVEIREPRTDIATGGTGGTDATTATTGGNSGVGGQGAGGAPSACPDGMAYVTDPAFPEVAFCIDKTEVTQFQYTQFLIDVGNDPNRTMRPTGCENNAELEDSTNQAFCPTEKPNPDRAVNCVDWCDAFAYCAWAGKRLCGRLSDGAALAFDEAGANDEWEFVCTNGFKQDYPYGDAPDPCACYLPKTWEDDPTICPNNSGNRNLPAEVASLSTCEGGFSELYDMQGNVAEWTNRCEGDAEDANCVVRGGWMWAVVDYDDCHRHRTFRRNENNFYAGIRCCSDPLTQ